MSKNLFAHFIFAVFMLSVTGLSADVVQLAPSKDNTLYEESGDRSFGAGKYTFMGMTGGDMSIDPSLRRTLLAFDLTSIPANAVINSVEISLTIDQVPQSATTDFARLHRLTRDWGEGASDTLGPGGQGAPAKQGDATWTHTFCDLDPDLPCSGTETWNTTGGDFVEAESASTPFGNSSPETITFTSTEALITDVQSWVKNPASNFGWILLGDENTEKNARRMASRESTDVPGPSLTIDYSILTQATVTPDPDPADGPLTKLAQPGGSTDPYMVTFMETGGEGVDGTLNGCTVDDSAFVITSPAAFPATVPADDSVAVNVIGTDPGGVDSLTATLSCNYTDGADETTAVTYILVMDIGGNGTFVVTKDFTDDSMGEVDVTITCDTGLPLTQTHTITEANGVGFVVKSFESGEMNCSITEDSEAGYIPLYAASGDSIHSDDEPDNPGCHFFNVDGGDNNVCHIINTPAPVAVRIEKVWIDAGASDDEISDDFGLTLYCDSEIVGGNSDYGGEATSSSSVPDYWYKDFSGSGHEVFTAMVIPDYPSSNCHVEEAFVNDTVDVDNGCGNLTVSVGMGDSCTITNSVFFEGIPTLNQYGLAILSLLMLGVGMVGFRKFTF